MKKFEFDFTNEWKSAEYGFDFIKVGYFKDDGYFDFQVTLLGFAFEACWNSDASIKEDKMWEDFIKSLDEDCLCELEECSIGVLPTKAKKVKKAVKKVAKKVAKKAKTTKKSK